MAIMSLLPHVLPTLRSALTGKHDTLVRRAPGWQGALRIHLTRLSTEGLGPGMVKCVVQSRLGIARTHLPSPYTAHSAMVACNGASLTPVPEILRGRPVLARSLAGLRQSKLPAVVPFACCMSPGGDAA